MKTPILKVVTQIVSLGKVKLRKTLRFIWFIQKKISQENVFLAIECLLKLKGRKDESNISVTRSDVSQIFQATSLEVAALYYITYIFKQKWGHADAAFLRTVDNKELNDSKTVKKAFKAYEKWFRSVKKLGLIESRKQELDPLADTDISWY